MEWWWRSSEAMYVNYLTFSGVQWVVVIICQQRYILYVLKGEWRGMGRLVWPQQSAAILFPIVGGQSQIFLCRSLTGSLKGQQMFCVTMFLPAPSSLWVPRCGCNHQFQRQLSKDDKDCASSFQGSNQAVWGERALNTDSWGHIPPVIPVSLMWVSVYAF